MTVTDLATERAERAHAALNRLRALADQAATEDEAREVAQTIRAFIRRLKAGQWEPYPWQHPHVHPEGWTSERAPHLTDKDNPGLGVCDERCLTLPTLTPGVHEAWLQRGGRGTGKTEGASHYVNAHIEGPACDPRVPGGHRVTIVAPTQPDAVTSCVTGVTGLQAINPGVTVQTTKEGTLVRWPSGAVGRVLGAHDAKDVDRARAWTNVCLWWLEEAAAMNHLGGLAHEGGESGVLDQADFTLRLGANPHLVVTTTPRNTPEVIRLIERSTIQTWGRTSDADRLPAPIRASYVEKWGGTTLGRQELDGEVIGDVVGAMWVQRRPDPLPLDWDDDRPGIENDRVPPGSVAWTPHGIITNRFGVTHNPAPPEQAAVVCQRVVVGVDPAGGATETGIVVVGEAHQHAYTLADLTTGAGPDMWGKTAVIAAYEYGAEGIALERTFGGDQTEHVIATAAEALGLPMPAMLKAPTPEGKKARAIPVQALSQQHRVHHVGHLPKLEGEQTTWVEDETPESPNRLDAWVHAVRHLLVRARTSKVSTPQGRRARTTSGGLGPARTQRGR